MVGSADGVPHRMLSADEIDGLVDGMVVEVQTESAIEAGIVVIDERGTWIQLS